MITPKFELNQDENFILIRVEAPYSRVSDAEVFVDEKVFKFYSKPYILNLHLQGCIVDDEHSSCVYDSDKGEYSIKISKQVPGEYFEDLCLLTKFLSPTEQKLKTTPCIEVITGENSEVSDDEEEELDWLFAEESDTLTLTGYGVGFANQKFDAHAKLMEEVDLVQVNNPEKLSRIERKMLREAHEDDKFDPHHYLADLFENDSIEEFVKLVPPWCKQPYTEEFLESEKFALKNFANKEYLIEKNDLQEVYLGLIDILYGCAYNWRFTEGEANVESAWTIKTLSSTLSWFDHCSDLPSKLRSCYRRALVFPLFRSWTLAETCHRDVVAILSHGKKCILKRLLETYAIFNECDPNYVINDLFIKDYCIWIQKANSKTISSLAVALENVKITKENVGFELVDLENAAQVVLSEENCNEKSPHDVSDHDADKLSDQMKKISLASFDKV